jgi:sulfoxide reductase catalytic subunit YedY
MDERIAVLQLQLRAEDKHKHWCDKVFQGKLLCCTRMMNKRFKPPLASRWPLCQKWAASSREKSRNLRISPDCTLYWCNHVSINRSDDIKSNEVTPERAYRSRRQVMRAGVLAGSAAATAWVYRRLNPRPAASDIALNTNLIEGVLRGDGTFKAELSADDRITPISDITHYNNFYEFSTDKAEVADVAEGFVARPWTIEIAGLCAKPKTLDIDDLLKISPPEERVYRMRCVEAWSMVIPWIGIPLGKLLDHVEPQASAKYVAFQTLFDARRMPNQSARVLQWPYVEGLRMDEAMHPLTILASGLYGRQLPPQNGAPLRLVVPWKYGFKGIKSIVKISLVASRPQTTWSAAAPDEYGFYANVNPQVDHPRWSQASEQRIGAGSGRRRPTLPFNGYADQVASLYAGMDLRANF